MCESVSLCVVGYVCQKQLMVLHTWAAKFLIKGVREKNIMSEIFIIENGDTHTHTHEKKKDLIAVTSK